MLILLSPAKSLDFTNSSIKKLSSPRFPEASNSLIGIMKTKSAKEIGKLMSISDKLAQLNKERYASFSDTPSSDYVKQALLAFKGDVYIGLENDTLNEKDLSWAQDHVRILSGLYGVLRPLDAIQPYRLEMGTQLKNSLGKDLYAFWGTRITDLLNEDLRKNKSSAIINLASQEYFAAVKPELLKGQLYHVNFLEKRDGKYKFISFTAKKARGWMCRYLIDQRATNPEEMKEFKGQGFRFTKSLSSENEYVFTRPGR